MPAVRLGDDPAAEFAVALGLDVVRHVAVLAVDLPREVGDPHCVEEHDGTRWEAVPVRYR